MAEEIKWLGQNIEQDQNNRLVSDNQITKWDNKLEDITINDWNNAIKSGMYNSKPGASNAPVNNIALAGKVIASGRIIIQRLYGEDTSTDEMPYYIRKGFIDNSNNITWTKWFIGLIYLEEILTRIIKGYSSDLGNQGNIFNSLIPSTVTSIIFTDIKMPDDATLIDVDDDGDGGVVAWLDTTDNTKMYISTQKEGVKVEGNSNIQKMFYGKKLTSLDLSNFDTSNVTNMGNMFGRCSVTSLDLSKWDTSNVTDMNNMFNSCDVTSLDLSNFDTSNVTDMSNMFGNNKKLYTIKVGDKFKWIGTLAELGLPFQYTDETGTMYDYSDTFPSNVAHTYTQY